MKPNKTKIWTIISVSMILIVVSVYFVAVQRAEYLMGIIVDEQSDGKLKLEVGKVSLDVLDLRFDFQNVAINSNDTAGLDNAYRIASKRLYLNVNSLTSVLFGKRISIDSVLVESPLIEVLKLRENKHQKLSITDELNKSYAALEKVLKVIKLNSFKINNAAFRIFKGTFNDQSPLSLSNIFLTIDSFKQENSTDKDKFLYADRIVLEVYNADIAFGDSAGNIRFKRFWMGTKSRIVKLDSCYIYNHSRKHEGNHYEVFLDSIRIIKLDLNAFAKDRHLIFDSAYCVNPVLDLALNLKPKENGQMMKRRLSDQFHFDHKIAGLTGPMNAGHLALHNATVKLALTKEGKTTLFSSSRSGFVFDSLVIGKHHKEIVYAKKMRVDINNQSYTTADSLYHLTFDSLSLMNKKIILSDLELRPTKHNKGSKIKYIKAVRFELDSMSWAALLTDSRIDATKAYLFRPEVAMKIPNSRSIAGSDSIDNKVGLDAIKEKLKLNEFRIVGGNFDIESGNQMKVIAKDVNLDIDTKKLLKAELSEDYLKSILEARIRMATIREKQMKAEMLDASFSGSNGTFMARKLKLDDGHDKIYAELDHLTVNGFVYTGDEGLWIEKLDYKTLKAKVLTDNDDERQQRSPRTAKPELKITLMDFHGGSTDILLNTVNIKLNLIAENLTFGLLKIAPHQNPVLKGLETNGSLLHFSNTEGMVLEMSNFNISDRNASRVQQFVMQMPMEQKQMKLQLKNLSFEADFNSILQKKAHIKFIHIHNPVVTSSHSFELRTHHKKQKKEIEFPDFKLDNLTVDELNPAILNDFLKQKHQLPEGSVSVELKGLKGEKGKLSLNDLLFIMNEPEEIAVQEIQGTTGKELLKLKASAIFYDLNHKSDSLKWAARIDELTVNNFPMDQIAADSSLSKLRISSLRLKNLALNNNLNGMKEIIEEGGREMSAENGNFSFENDKVKVGVHNLSVKDAGRTILLDSITYTPSKSKESFLAEKGFQTVYMQMNSGNIAIEGFDLEKLLNNKEVAISQVSLKGLKLYTYKDKRYPFRHGVVKPMLTELLMKIKQPVSVDSLHFSNAEIVYEEFNDRTQQEGMIKLTELRGIVRNIKSSNATPADSLHFSLYAKLLDTAVFRASYKQSYLDTLHGFKLNLVANSLDIKALNPILHPFASANILSGKLDTIRMSSIGRKYVAFGTMRMYYKGLKVEYINKGDTSNKTFITRSVSFLANRIVRKNHRWGKGEVYAERDFEKGFVNYWVKIVIGGVLTNTGVRSNRKQERKYEHAIRKHEVPPISNIPTDF